jgi:serine/threonine protein kinase
VAVKLINDEEVAQDEVLLARFAREAEAAAKVHSPHIVEMLGSGHDEKSGLPYMVMELLEGENALQLLQRLGPMPPQLALAIGVQTCIGLAEAHGVGVVHRDIKPANLFLSEGASGEVNVKLLDFGVAKFKMDQALESGGESLTRTGSMLGSPLYMSPEQARGLKTIDHRADIWSLGIVMYQLLTGRQPHEGIDGLGELIITICSEPPPAATKFAPWISAKVVEVVQGALKLTSSERYQTAAEMGDALKSCLSDRADWQIDKTMLVPLSDEQKAAAPEEKASGAAAGLDATIALTNPEQAAMLDAQLSPSGPGGAPPAMSSEDAAATMALDMIDFELPPEEEPSPKPAPKPGPKPEPEPAAEQAPKKRRAASPAPNRALEVALAAARLDDSRKSDQSKSKSRMMIALFGGLILGVAALVAYALLRVPSTTAPGTPSSPTTASAPGTDSAVPSVPPAEGPTGAVPPSDG